MRNKTDDDDDDSQRKNCYQSINQSVHQSIRPPFHPSIQPTKCSLTRSLFNKFPEASDASSLYTRSKRLDLRSDLNSILTLFLYLIWS